jgi:hypothetical protein
MSIAVVFGLIRRNNVVEHPAFPQPTDQNAAIWRYMTFDKFESLVTSRTLYMRRADKFPGDEFEGTTPAGDVAAWEGRAKNAPTEAERAAILQSREQLAEYAQVFRQNYFLSCWHMAPDENVAMWERYVSGTTDALVVRARYSNLKAQLNPAVMNFGMVRYIDYDVQTLPSMNMLERITHKRHYFSDEREARAVMWAMKPDPIRKEFIEPHLTADGFGYAPPIDVKKLIEGVVLHPKATSEFEARVSAFCRANGLPTVARSRMASSPQF